MIFQLAFAHFQSPPPVLTGLDQIRDYEHLFAFKKIGIVTNHTAINRAGLHITDILPTLSEVRIVALFGPEHGVRGHAVAGETVENQVGSLSEVPVYSLYGNTKKPTSEMLRGIDLLVFDIQDIGARFYTYIWTLFHVMQAAAEHNIPLVVLDRPNPVTGKVEGPILDQQFSSFIGLQPLPVRHGMTIGELAQLYNGEGWLGENLRTDLTVIPLKNWRRDIWFEKTGLEFFPPSPNMPDLETATIYPGACLLEGTNVSEGRGTETPFLVFGAPWIASDQLCDRLNSLRLTGLCFEPAEFIPVAIAGKVRAPAYENTHCYGAKIHITHRDNVEPFFSGVCIVQVLHDLYPNDFQFRQDGFFDKLCGTDEIRESIEAGGNILTLREKWRQQHVSFDRMKKKYLLYE
ncbi:DUF1343 domain-containing protein [candidate division KSB1 bacterium]|nr:DUF1343 domain-containing protein [candidate division KSB1 bacterium]RQW04167.1 MAG: DUF1343 domain-containing protein [candidate division KSB1 bacterium]